MPSIHKDQLSAWEVKIVQVKKTWFGVDQETTYELRFFSEILESPRLDPTYTT